jgi:predicted membrane protein
MFPNILLNSELAFWIYSQYASKILDSTCLSPLLVDLAITLQMWRSTGFRVNKFIRQFFRHSVPTESILIFIPFRSSCLSSWIHAVGHSKEWSIAERINDSKSGAFPYVNPWIISYRQGSFKSYFVMMMIYRCSPSDPITFQSLKASSPVPH